MPHVKTVISERFKKHKPVIDDIALHGMPEGAEVIYEGRNILYRIRFGEETVIVKDFRRPNAVNSFIYTTLRKSKAARSYENAMMMRRLGFDSPEPVAYAEVKEGIRLRRSIYVCKELSGATEMRHWEDFSNASTLVPAFAREMLRLHNAGVWHKDFSPGNVLYTGDDSSGYTFHYVDLNRMKFGVKKRGKLMRMFRAINLNPVETRRLAHLYAEAAGEDPDKLESEALGQLNGYFAERKRKRFFKNLFKR